jgi:hypothetical protein
VPAGVEGAVNSYPSNNTHLILDYPGYYGILWTMTATRVCQDSGVARALVLLLILFSGCSNPKPAAEKTNQQTGCVRGEPEALLATGSEFRKSSAGEATETIPTTSPIRLTVRHFGCTHYALDFEFTWPGERMPDPPAALREAAAILSRLPLKATYRPAINGIAEALRKMALEPYKQPMTMSETETLTATTPALSTLRIRYDVAI